MRIITSLLSYPEGSVTCQYNTTFYHHLADKYQKKHANIWSFQK